MKDAWDLGRSGDERGIGKEPIERLLGVKLLYIRYTDCIATTGNPIFHRIVMNKIADSGIDIDKMSRFCTQVKG